MAKLTGSASGGDRRPRSTAEDGPARRAESSKTKYQIFISSTFKDLQQERQAVSRAVLELNHIPAGMELFPAFDQSQLDFIKRVIDDCDYYIIILGGRYGSLTKEGISFTEAEYDYAVEQGKPVIVLLHANVGKIPSENVDTDPEIKEKLSNFRDKLENGRLVKTWTDINDLKSNAIISLTASFDQMPQTGWRRNDGWISEEALARMEAYRDEMELLRRRLRDRNNRLGRYEDLESAEIDIKYTNADGADMATVPADRIIREFAAPLKNGFDAASAKERLRSLIAHRYDVNVQEITDEAVDNIILFFEVFEIADQKENGVFKIMEDKIHLLKAAFRKQKEQKGRDVDDEIPF